MIKRQILFFCILFLALSISAQELIVKEFYANPNDVTAMAMKTKKLDANGTVCALIKVKTGVQNCEFHGFVVSQEQTGQSEYYVYLPEGVRHIEVQAPGFNPLKINFSDYKDVGQMESKTTYILVLENPMANILKPFMKENGFYFGGSYEIGEFSGITGHVGGTFHNIDVQLSYKFGLSKTTPINFYDSGDGSFLSKCDYTMNAFTAKLGYQVPLASKFGIVPQVGYSVQSLKCNVIEGTNGKGDGAICNSLSAGAKLIYSPIRHCCLYVAPEYDIACKKDKIFDIIATTAGFSAGGFCCNVGLLFNF